MKMTSALSVRTTMQQAVCRLRNTADVTGESSHCELSVHQVQWENRTFCKMKSSQNLLVRLRDLRAMLPQILLHQVAQPNPGAALFRLWPDPHDFH